MRDKKQAMLCSEILFCTVWASSPDGMVHGGVVGVYLTHGEDYHARNLFCNEMKRLQKVHSFTLFLQSMTLHKDDTSSPMMNSAVNPPPSSPNPPPHLQAPIPASHLP